MKSAHPTAVAAARALFAAGAIWWVVLSVLLWLGVVSIGHLDETTLAIVAALMLADGVAMALFAWQTFRRRRWVDYLAVLFVVANLVLTVTDEVGAADLVYLAFIVVLLVATLLGLRRVRTEAS